MTTNTPALTDAQVNELIYARKNAILTEREDQLELNWLSVKSGKPYIERRLFRAPNESDLSWTGTRLGQQQEGMIGRKDRAAPVDDAGRVSQKINQYLFSKPAARVGLDPQFEKDVTGTGTSVNSFWQDASEMLTACQWLWIQVDRGAPAVDSSTGQRIQRTRAQRIADNDRIRWAIWQPWCVVDWCHDQTGRLIWLLTEEERTDNTNPAKPACTVKYRRLWKYDPNGATWQVYQQSSTKSGRTTIAIVDEGTVSSPEIPFILLGKPSTDPHWFDLVEFMQAQLLNLDSIHVDSIIKTVFPQMVISAGQFEALSTKLVESYGQDGGQRVLQVIKELVRSQDSPMIEGADESGITRFINPDATGMSIIPTEIDRKRKLLFDMVGLALFNRETRQVQTVESKQFDHLDTETTLRHRAIVMQECEIKCVEMSVKMDTTFQPYIPVWPQEFGIIDALQNIQVAVQAGNMPGLVMTYRKALQRVVGATIDSLVRLTDDEKAAAAQEIDAMEDVEFSLPMDASPPADDEPPTDDEEIRGRESGGM